MNTYWTELAFVVVVHTTFMWVSNMIIRVLRNVYLFISQSSLYCIILYVLHFYGIAISY